MGKPSTPPPPDYRAAAEEQGAANQATLAQQTYANRPSQSSPWGMMDWTTGTAIDPSSGEEVTTWQQNQSLDPRLQQGLEDQLVLGNRRTDLARYLGGRVNRALDNPFDSTSSRFRDVTEMSDPNTYRERGEQGAYDRMTSRLDPRFEDEQEALTIRLRNQGLRPGDEAYESEMDRFNRTKTDAYQAAMNESIGAGRQESDLAFGQGLQQQAQSAQLRSQEIAEALQDRGMPLQEINALLAGQGIQPAFGGGVPQAGAAQAPNYVGAAQSQYDAAADAYNAQAGQQQGLMSGLFGLGSAALGGPWGMFSDHRLKRRIKVEGELVPGVHIYSFEYVWGGPRVVGLMAHEVPELAFEDARTGFLKVDYSALH